MYDTNQDKQIIMEVGGHTSNAARMYKHISDKIRRQASAAIQGAIKLGDDVMKCDENGQIVVLKDKEEKRNWLL